MASILVVDDQSENLRFFAEMLEQQGYVVRSLRDGRLVMPSVRSSPPDLILLDIKMPEMDGYDVCQQLKADEQTRDIPVIFLSALSEVFDKVKAFSIGGVDYLTKPVQQEEVVARIKTHLTIRTLQQQLQEHNARLEKQNIRLEEQNERFRTLSEATFEGILIHDEGRILEVNQMMLTMFGYQHAELLGRHVLEFVSPESRDIIAEHIRTKAEHSYEAEGIRKDKSTFPLEIQAKTMPYEGRDVSVASVRDLSWRKALQEEKARLLRETIPDRYKFEGIIGKSPAMQAVYQSIVKASASNTNVVICGESGTGKELVARTIHQRSARHEEPFVAIKCGAVSEFLFEREFFGHRKGAFTGADQDSPGFFDQAHKGTLFLDEIGELRPPFQVKLLRVLEEKAFIPVGHTIRKTVDVRIIAATNSNLPELLGTGAIRKDFFYRICVTEINLPPLRDHREDIPLLVDHFLNQYSEGKVCCSMIPGHIIEALCTYDWPGNVRELQNELQRYLSEQRLEFIGDVQATSEIQDGVLGPGGELANLALPEALEAFEKRTIIRTLTQHQGNTVKTAEVLGISLRTLQRKIKRYRIENYKDFA